MKRRMRVCSIDIFGIIALIPTRRKRASDSWPHPDPSVCHVVLTRERRVREACTLAQSIVKRSRAVSELYRAELMARGADDVHNGTQEGCSRLTCAICTRA